METLTNNPHVETVAESMDRLTTSRFNVLVADDSEDDLFLAVRQLRRSTCLDLVGTVANGEDVKSYLTGTGIFADRRRFPFPDLLLLDSDMPRSNGFEVLAWIKSQSFPALRIVMLSSRIEPEAGVRALRLGADYFQAKTANLLDLQILIHRLEFLMLLLENREPRKQRLPSLNNLLTVVDGRAPTCRETIRAAAEAGRNFILVLDSEKDLEKLWSTLGTTTVVPDRLDRWGLLALVEALAPQDFEFLQKCNREKFVYLVEQITLNRNVPPRTKRYMIYCDVRGIISDHDTVEEAGFSLLSYLTGFKVARRLPLAGIYDHSSGKWERVQSLRSD